MRQRIFGARKERYRRMMHIGLAGGLILLLLAATTQPAQAAQEEWRAFWVVRGGDLHSEEAIDRVLAVHKNMNFQAAFVQVNGRFEAYYKSSIVPQAPNIPEGFDPLAYFVERAHQEGIEVHAWINAFTASPFGTFSTDLKHVIHAHPEWVTHDRTGQSIRDYDAGHAVVDVIPAVFLEPGLPEVQTFVAAMVREVAENYAVDGIHLDYIRYPSPDYGYHPDNRRRFEAAYGVDPLDLAQNASSLAERLGLDELNKLTAAWDQFRVDNVTNVMRHIYWDVKRVNPDIWVSAAVVAELENDFAIRRRFQDWPGWIREGVVDAVVPMAYSPDGDQVARQIRQAALVVGSRDRLVAGFGAYQISDPDAMAALIQRVRLESEPGGLALFSYGSSVAEDGYLERLRELAF